jgi:DNA polymerase III alpha subunit
MVLTKKEMGIIEPMLTGNVDIYNLLGGFFEVTTVAGRKMAGQEVPMLKRCAVANSEIKSIQKEMQDTDISILLAKEKFLLGITFSANEVDLYNTSLYINDCREFVTGASGGKMSFMGVIESVRIHVDKSKREMAFISFSDSTYMIDGGVVFASIFGKIKPLIEKDRIVLLKGKKQDNSFLIDDVKNVF